VTELLEMVKVVAAVENWKCPFEHYPVKHDKENIVPPPTSENNAKTLSSRLDTESKHVKNISIRFQISGKKYPETVKFTAHHLVPGNEAWPSSQLYKWIDARGGHICGDIEYDVNAAANGVDLPGNSAASRWAGDAFQTRYAFNAMVADKKKRQFHDRHPAYSDFVVNVLNKIASKLQAKEPDLDCGKTGCQGAKKVKGKYAPPYRLLGRIDGVALRLERKLTGDSRRWKKPVMTSRFANMFCKRGLSQDDARAQLETDQFIY
jgi:A nuclease family of the HNH/ENDO VII superfamily with conserved AHH